MARAYGNGQALGLSIREVEALTFWQYTAALHEFNRRQNNPGGGEPMTEAEYDDMLEELRAWNLSDMRV